MKGSTFGQHIAERTRKSLVAMSTIEKPQQLSLTTLKALFDLKVASVAAYGIQVIWEHLSLSQLEKLDKVKPTFFKLAIGLPRNAKNRLVYLMTSTQPLIEFLVTRFRLSETAALIQFRENFIKKVRAVPGSFFNSPAMVTQNWQRRLQPNRHLVTRYSLHGFHHKLCHRRGFHDPDVGCVCRLCNQPCPIYHLDTCQMAISLTQLAR